MSIFSGSHEPPKNGDQMLECYHCWYKTKNKLSLEDHMRLSHLVEKPFKCDKCDFRAIRKNHLLQHMKVHVLNIYGCSICDFKSYDRERVKRHLNIHNVDTTKSHNNKGTKPTERKQHGYKAVEKSGINEHTTSHSVKREYACDYCEHTSNHKNELKLHKLSHKGKMPYMCNHCGYVTTRKSNLRRHMNRHTGEKPFACYCCDYRTSFRSSLKTHIRTHTGEKPFGCTYCNYRTSDRGCFIGHVSTHTGEKFYACDICEFKTNSSGNLRGHKQWNHSKPKTCEECGFLAPNIRIFNNHRRLKHTMEKPFSCEQCAYTSYNRTNFVAHQKIHGEKKITCTYCPYTARRSRDMKRHLDNVHSTQKKRFKCKECNYRTADKKAFKKHERVHTGQKPFGCTVCDKTYNRRPALNDHTVKVHARKKGEESYVCNLCDFMTAMHITKTAKEMAQHILSSHTAQDVPPATVETSQPNATQTSAVTVRETVSCSVCHEVFDERLALQDHIVSNHARKEDTGSFVCNMCDFNFPIYSTKTAEDMSEHILSSHTRDIPWKTLDTSVPVESNGNLVSLDIVDYVCNICEHKTNIVSDMAKHMLAAHSTLEATATMVLPVGTPTLTTFLASDAPGTQLDKSTH